MEDTVHIFVNHWPSKLGGEKKSMQRRMEAANLLKTAIDSIQHTNQNAIIIAMGDFNDSPQSSPVQAIPLNNLSLKLRDSLKHSHAEITGSHKYNGKWEMLDQFLVSENLKAKADILSFPHLLQQDKKYQGSKTRRTFTGPRFNAGASDHLPILLKMEKKQ